LFSDEEVDDEIFVVFDILKRLEYKWR